MFIRGDNFTTEENAATTNDGGLTWQAVDPSINPGGYRSAVAYYDSSLILACGKQSCDYADPLNSGFKAMDGGYYTVSVSPDGRGAYASGPSGKIAKLKFQ